MDLWAVAGSVVGAVVVALLALTARWVVHVRDTVMRIDDGVNNVHKRSPREDGKPHPGLYDLAAETRALTVRTDQRVEDHIGEVDQRTARLERKVDTGFRENHKDHEAMIRYVNDEDERLRVRVSHDQINRIAQLTREIDRAVNTRPTGDPTMGDDVASIEARGKRDDERREDTSTD